MLSELIEGGGCEVEHGYLQQVAVDLARAETFPFVVFLPVAVSYWIGGGLVLVRSVGEPLH